MGRGSGPVWAVPAVIELALKIACLYLRGSTQQSCGHLRLRIILNKHTCRQVIYYFHGDTGMDYTIHIISTGNFHGS